MKNKKMLIVIYMLLALIVMSGCSNDDDIKVGSVVDGYTVLGDIAWEQLQLPKVGEEIIVITTNMGVIKMRFFEDVAPQTVTKLKALTSQGFYDGLLFSRVVEDFVIQVQTLTEETEEEVAPYIPEYHDDYRHFNGAVGLARFKEQGNSTSFYIIANSGLEKAYLETMKEVEGTEGPLYSEGIIDIYRALGGAPGLDMRYTVFGQVFYGLDTVMKINKTPLHPDSEMPAEPVVVENMELVLFEAR